MNIYAIVINHIRLMVLNDSFLFLVMYKHVYVWEYKQMNAASHRGQKSASDLLKLELESCGSFDTDAENRTLVLLSERAVHGVNYKPLY